MYSGRSVSEQSLPIIRRALVADALNVHAVLLAAKDDIPPGAPLKMIIIENGSAINVVRGRSGSLRSAAIWQASWLWTVPRCFI
jgi:hypothetical protein